jgi:hypothetical protein
LIKKSQLRHYSASSRPDPGKVARISAYSRSVAGNHSILPQEGDRIGRPVCPL